VGGFRGNAAMPNAFLVTAALHTPGAWTPNAQEDDLLALRSIEDDRYTCHLDTPPTTFKRGGGVHLVGANTTVQNAIFVEACTCTVSLYTSSASGWQAATDPCSRSWA